MRGSVSSSSPRGRLLYLLKIPEDHSSETIVNDCHDCFNNFFDMNFSKIDWFKKDKGLSLPTAHKLRCLELASMCD